MLYEVITKHLTTKDGLADNSICSIIIDKNNGIWIATNNGLSHYKEEANAFYNYYKEDGLPGNQFFIQSALKTKKGELYFGGTNGFCSFYPDSLKKNTSVSKVIITDFYVHNKKVDYKFTNSPLSKPIQHTKEISLNYDQSFFTFEFLAINYTYPLKNKYKYMLEGLDKDWIETDAKARIAIYTNINPGTYIFKVKASNNDGLWNETATVITSYSIHYTKLYDLLSQLNYWQPLSLFLGCNIL